VTDPHPAPATATAPTVLAHGFTQNARCWGPFAAALAAHRPVRPVDLPGHGGAAPAADLDAAAARLGLEGGTAPYVGYSLGGRVALHLALARPDLVEVLVLIGAHPGIEDDDERAARRRTDDALADHLEAVGLEAFLDEWLAQSLFADLGPETDQRAERLANDAHGVAEALRHLGTGTQRPLWGELGTLEVPVLYVAGGRDERYTAIGRRVVATVGASAELVVVPDAGHAVHLARPAATAEVVAAFLSRPGPGRGPAAGR